MYTSFLKQTLEYAYSMHNVKFIINIVLYTHISCLSCILIRLRSSFNEYKHIFIGLNFRREIAQTLETFQCMFQAAVFAHAIKWST